MLDDAFQLSTDQTIADMAARPVAPKPQAPAFSVWGVVRGAGRGVPAGAAEAIASTAEILGAFGQVSAATGAKAGGMFSMQTEAERAETEKQAKAIREEGVDFRSEAGVSFRNVARDYMPDPVTAHGAEMAVAEFARLGTKAIAAGITMGPLAGAGVAGVEEGFTEAEKLAQQGVDVETRTKVGAVTGALTGASFAIPVAGKTVAGTVGLALAGGPAAFIGQNAATREILANAGYDRLADQYDPLDPTGILLSTIVPLGFGAMAMRSAARSKGGALPPVADDASVDAARVSLLRENVDAARVTPPEDLIGAQAHETAVAKAIDQMSAGQKVEVSDVIPESAAAQITETMAARMEGLRQEVEAMRVAGDLPEPPRVEPARYDINRLADEAGALLDGRPVGEVIGKLKASGVEVSPELQNMLIGVSEFAGRVPELLDSFRKAEGQKQAPVQDLIADAVESMRAPKEGETKVNPLQARIDSLIIGKPNALDEKMPTAFDDQGRVTESISMREYLDTVTRESQQDAADAELIQVAANCFLSGGF